MREILFRGKTSGNEWKCGCLITIGDCCFISKDMGFNKMVEANTVGQYTGLTDKNGTKIFEGDILTAYFVSNRSKQHFKVIFENGAFLFDNGSVKVPVWDIYSLEIIGNIHDNPELIKGGAEQ